MLLVIYSPKILSPNSEKYLESYNSDPPVVIRFLTYFHLLGSRIQDIEIKYLDSLAQKIFCAKLPMSLAYWLAELYRIRILCQKRQILLIVHPVLARHLLSD